LFLSKKLTTKITSKDIERQAKSIFRDFSKVKKDTDTIFKNLMGKDSGLWATLLLSSGDIMPEIIGKSKSYSQEMLKEEGFATLCIFKECTEKALGKRMSYPKFQILFKVLGYASMSKYSKSEWSNETKILKNFNIDPRLLPDGVRSKIYALDEFIKATEIITARAQGIKSIKEGFETYSDYYEYVYKEVEKITYDLRARELFNHQKEDRLTVILISLKLRMPFNDVMYKNTNEDAGVGWVPTEVLKDAQEKAVNAIYFGNMDGGITFFGNEEQ
jgi:hypothetical protein